MPLLGGFENRSRVVVSNGVGVSKIVRGLSRMCHELVSRRCLCKGIISVLLFGPGSLYDRVAASNGVGVSKIVLGWRCRTGWGFRKS